MDKKILIGSIIAVAILIGVSFTSVVGYSSVKSTSGKASPLFSVRTNRAIEEESKDLNSKYVGIGEESILSIPKRDNRIQMLQRFIDIISRMDDRTFNRFLEKITTLINQDDTSRYIKAHSLVYALKQIRNNPKLIHYNVDDADTELIILGENFTYNGGWQPGCNIYLVLFYTWLLGMITFYVTLVIYYKIIGCEDIVSYRICTS